MKVSQLSGPALDWAVAKCEGKDSYCEIHAGNVLYGNVTLGFVHYRPSSYWSQGGPIIERENLTLFKRTNTNTPETERYQAVCGHEGVIHQGKRGPTYLIAAMRCFVASKLGEEVDIPKELL